MARGYHGFMRTSVTLDPDVVALLRDVMRREGVSFKQALNSAVRSGLTKSERVEPYEQRTFRMGFPPAFRRDKVQALADALEDEELVRRLAVRE